jgi:hypothetical protein
MKAAALVGVLLPAVALAVPEKGTIIQTDTLGMNIVSYDYNSATTKTIADRAELSEFVGVHYFFLDGLRVGLNLQFTERLEPAPANGGSYFRTFAILPQIGWHFYDPFFAALVMTIAPYIDGSSNVFTFGFQGVFGAGFSLTERVKLTAALEIPFNFVGLKTIGLTPLLGISIKL